MSTDIMLHPARRDLLHVEVRIDEEAVSLDSDMADRILPFLIIVRIRGNLVLYQPTGVYTL